ncbi:hypothetical protein ACRRTK_023135 [Alexandromys fortis]
MPQFFSHLPKTKKLPEVREVLDCKTREELKGTCWSAVGNVFGKLPVPASVLM